MPLTTENKSAKGNWIPKKPLTNNLLTGGADFGGGIWDLFAIGRRAKAQRALITEAIAPIWEANHVWLIVIVVLFFVAFPMAFAAISTALHIPLTLMLIGIVLRGSAFVSSALLGTYFHKRESLNRFQWDPAVPGLLQGLSLFHCFSRLANFRSCNPFRCTAINQ